MLREHLFHRRAPADPLFRWRGGDISRVEALSDAVFALTITLVVATTHVPGTFLDIWEIFLDVPVLAVCFALLVALWHDHYRFFRRYGLEDTATTVLNSILLFFVLLFAFPLKFLFSFLWRGLMLRAQPLDSFFPDVPDDVPFAGLLGQGQSQAEWMMILYGAGVAVVFAVLFLMHHRALRLRDALELDDIELELTRGSLRSHAGSCAIALLSLAIVITTGSIPVSGMIYSLNFPFHSVNGRITERRAERHGPPDPEPPAAPLEAGAAEEA